MHELIVRYKYNQSNRRATERVAADDEREMRARRTSSDGESMLQRLIDERDSKFIAHHEESSNAAMEFLNGIALMNMDDVAANRWHSRLKLIAHYNFLHFLVELVNSQMALFGCGGHVLCTAARAVVSQRFHTPVWRGTLPVGKASWHAQLTGMQYFAPLFADDPSASPSMTTRQDVDHDARMYWLSREDIDQYDRANLNEPHSPEKRKERRRSRKASLSNAGVDMNEQSPTSVSQVLKIAENHARKEKRHKRERANQRRQIKQFAANSDAVGGLMAPAAGDSPAHATAGAPQMQRVISRCSCQLYFCYYNDMMDFDDESAPAPPPVGFEC